MGKAKPSVISVRQWWELLETMSTRLVDTPVSGIDAEVQASLRRIGEFFGVISCN